jgi:hypothetical protein
MELIKAPRGGISLRFHLYRLLSGACATDVCDFRERSEMHFPASPLQAIAQIDFLGVHEEALVESADFEKCITANSQSCSEDPGY